MKRRVSLYGRLRDAGRGDAVQVDLPAGATAKDLLDAVASLLKGPALKGCAVATDDAVLPPSAKVPKTGVLAILPPVCGG